jgi:hypothetical protein
VTKQAKKKKLYRGRETGGDDDHGQAASGGVTSSSPLPLFLLAGPPARPPRDNITPSRRPRLHLLLTDTEPQPTVPPVIQSPAAAATELYRNPSQERPSYPHGPHGSTRVCHAAARGHAARGFSHRSARQAPASSSAARHRFRFHPQAVPGIYGPLPLPRSSCSALLIAPLPPPPRACLVPY